MHDAPVRQLEYWNKWSWWIRVASHAITPFVHIINAKDRELVCVVWLVLGTFCLKCQPFLLEMGLKTC